MSLDLPASLSTLEQSLRAEHGANAGTYYESLQVFRTVMNRKISTAAKVYQQKLNAGTLFGSPVLPSSDSNAQKEENNNPLSDVLLRVGQALHLSIVRYPTRAVAADLLDFLLNAVKSLDSVSPCLSLLFGLSLFSNEGGENRAETALDLYCSTTVAPARVMSSLFQILFCALSTIKSNFRKNPSWGGRTAECSGEWIRVAVDVIERMVQSLHQQSMTSPTTGSDATRHSVVQLRRAALLSLYHLLAEFSAVEISLPTVVSKGDPNGSQKVCASVHGGLHKALQCSLYGAPIFPLVWKWPQAGLECSPWYLKTLWDAHITSSLPDKNLWRPAIADALAFCVRTRHMSAVLDSIEIFAGARKEKLSVVYKPYWSSLFSDAEKSVRCADPVTEFSAVWGHAFSALSLIAQHAMRGAVSEDVVLQALSQLRIQYEPILKKAADLTKLSEEEAEALQLKDMFFSDVPSSVSQKHQLSTAHGFMASNVLPSFTAELFISFESIFRQF